MVRTICEKKELNIFIAQLWLGTNNVEQFCKKRLEPEEYKVVADKLILWIPWPIEVEKREDFFKRLGNPVDDTWVDPETIKKDPTYKHLLR